MDSWMLPLAVFRATTVLLSDWPSEQVDALFFHGRSHGDDDGLFEIAAEFYRHGTRIVLNGSDGERRGGITPGEAWPGKAPWTERLKALGVTDIVYSEPAFDSKQENEAFLDLAMNRGWKSGAILTQPHQAVRAFLGMVKSMADHGYWMRVYAVSPKSTLWWKPVYGSQGAAEILRFGHIEEEFNRIRPYQQKGDLACFAILFDYLQRRSEIR